MASCRVSKNATTTYVNSSNMYDFTEHGKNYLGKYKINFFGDLVNIYSQGLAQK